MFVAFEGIDGTGKTTLVSLVKKEIEGRGFRVFATSEPTGRIELKEELKKSREISDALSLFFRFTEDRFVHQREISEHLGKGEIVLCDRYIMSSMAYQGAILEKYFSGKDKTLQWMLAVSEIIDVRPDITFYIDVEPEVAMKRIAGRGSLTGFEEKEYLSGVRNFYNSIDFKGKITLDGSGTLQQSLSDIMERLSPHLTR